MGTFVAAAKETEQCPNQKLHEQSDQLGSNQNQAHKALDHPHKQRDKSTYHIIHHHILADHGGGAEHGSPGPHWAHCAKCI